ncbi:MAG: glycosyltransferase family 2 protein [Steroidobacteraceae bacterium]
MRPLIEPDVTVLIPTVGRPVLERAIAAIECGTAWPCELVVVDQSVDAIARKIVEAACARGFPARWLACDGRGRSLGLNTGLSQIRSRIVLITDDDCLARMDWLQSMVARLRANPGCLVTGRVLAEDGAVQLSVAVDDREVLQVKPSPRFDRLSGGNMGFHRLICERVGPFSTQPAMRTAEDAEYAYRALRMGVPILYAPEVCVTHLGWRDQSARTEQYRSYALSQSGMFGWYVRQGDVFMLLRSAVHLLRCARRWLLGSLKGDREMATNGRSYLMYFFLGFSVGWKAWASSGRGRKR